MPCATRAVCTSSRPIGVVSATTVARKRSWPVSCQIRMEATTPESSCSLPTISRTYAQRARLCA